MNTFVGRDWTKSVDDNWPRFLETWRPLIEHAEQHDIKVGIENCPMLFTADEWPGGKNLAQQPGDLGDGCSTIFPAITLDSTTIRRTWSFSRWTTLTPMREFARSNFSRSRQGRARRSTSNSIDVGILAHPNDYHTPKLPGMGEVDWGKFFSTLTDTGYSRARFASKSKTGPMRARSLVRARSESRATSHFAESIGLSLLTDA